MLTITIADKIARDAAYDHGLGTAPFAVPQWALAAMQEAYKVGRDHATTTQAVHVTTHRFVPNSLIHCANNIARQAEGLMEDLNLQAAAADDGDHALVEQAESNITDDMRALRSAIYEYRKRLPKDTPQSAFNGEHT